MTDGADEATGHGYQCFSEAPLVGAPCSDSYNEVGGGNELDHHHHYPQAPAQQAYAGAPPYDCDNNNNPEANNLVQPHHWAYVDAGQLIQLQESAHLAHAFYQTNQEANHCCNDQQQQQQVEERLVQPLQQFNPQQFNAQLQPVQEQQPLALEGAPCLNWALTPLNAKPNKALKHNLIERKRRVRIKDCCELLKNMVPGLVAKSDKARVLEQTVKYLSHIHACASSTLCECQMDAY